MVVSKFSLILNIYLYSFVFNRFNVLLGLINALLVLLQLQSSCFFTACILNKVKVT